MKDIRDILNESRLINKKKSANTDKIDGFYTIPFKNEASLSESFPIKKGAIVSDNIKYILLYPLGAVYLFTEDGLNDYIAYLDQLIDDYHKGKLDSISDVEDMIGTYEELRDLEKVGEWVALSGPYSSKSKVQDTLGMRFY